MRVSAASLAALNLVLERGVARRHSRDGLGCRIGKHASAEVRVHDRASRVDDRAKRRARGQHRAGACVARDRLGGCVDELTGKQPGANVVDGAPHGIDDERPSEPGGLLGELGVGKDRIYLRQAPQRFVSIHGAMIPDAGVTALAGSFDGRLEPSSALLAGVRRS